jgi:hypothetical protein
LQRGFVEIIGKEDPNREAPRAAEREQACVVLTPTICEGAVSTNPLLILDLG